MRAVEVDGSTLYCLGASTDPAAVADRLGVSRVRVEPAAPGAPLAHKMVALAAHDLSAAQLAEICSSTADSWVHLVSSGFGYPHVAALARTNLVTRSARAYAAALSDYVVTHHVLYCARQAAGAVPKPFNRRTALVVGFGAFGRTVAGALARLGVRVTVIRPRSRTAHPFGREQAAIALGELPDRAADLLVVALPEMAELAGFIDEKLLRCLRPDGHIVNPARPSPVDFDALLRWLASGSGHLTADVEEGERERRLAPWAERDRVTLTPHIAWQPWDHDPLYHGDWLDIYATATPGAAAAEGRVRIDPREIAEDYLIP
ncbi:NAD(P)-dependent oxidoreductase [Nocardia pseudobrasiliensis]|uniref:D-isomer specific 2-hydroxyacid dehydrogenase-like protein n=1 Tax=Nocardia pseudobrasiliensis TaxID=45979 RepID=A0A370HPX8_9NOCA|nr:NAD(P)-dependent oxidoreductase [Nocardia pseudobrasiliensis]RDI60325.1 D-isomer specific 2-hydroxyacid dehydrogenase-like protein [Nocardia pseudobrasiliensis]